MSLSWTQRVARLSNIIHTDIVTDDEDQQGKALDEYLASTKDPNSVHALRFSDNDLIFIGKLADGQFGTIDVVRCRIDSKVYVRKTVEKRTALRARGQCFPQLERKLLIQAAKTNSHWAPHLLCTFQTDIALKFVMQYADGGNLWDLIESSPDGKVQECDLKWWLPQIVNAIDWCHSQGFVHRDVKPHNFVITPSSHMLLVDFGSAAPLLPRSSSGVQTVPREYCLVPCGTCDYISPEILQCHEEALVALELEEESSSQHSQKRTPSSVSCYGRETDWWSFGAMVYEMTYGVAPFFAQDIGHTYAKIMDHRTSLKFDGTATLSHNGIFLMKALLRDCESRLGRHSTDEIRQQPFFQNVNWQNLHKQKRPDQLHVPRFTYSVTAAERLMNPLDHGSDESSEQYSQPFQFTALFQSSQTMLGASFLQNTPLPSKNSPANPTNTFLGFTWGPRLNAFSSQSVSDPELQTMLHREPVMMTPRPPSAIRRPSALVSEIVAHPYTTPIRQTPLPFSTAALQGTASNQRTKERRPMTDREAMQQLVDCVGMSAHKKVLASGKKPRFLHTMDSHSRGSKKFNSLSRPLVMNTKFDDDASETSSETDSQPPSPTPRPSSALSRTGWGGRSTPSLIAGRTTPTLTFTATATTLGTGGSDPSGTLPSHLQQPKSRGNKILDQRLDDVERRYHKLLDEISHLEEDIGNVTLRLSRPQ